MIYRSLNLEAFDYTKVNDVESFSVRIFSSPAGGMNKSEAVTVTLKPDLRKRIRRLEKGDLNLQEMIAVGEELGDALLPSRVRPLYRDSRAALAENEGLRIRLMLDAYELADIPWEFCYVLDNDTPLDQKDYRGFLALDIGVSILRDPILEQRRLELKPVADQRLRMVVLLSNPQGTDELNLEKERQNIVEAVAGLQDLDVHYCPQGTVAHLLKAMIDGAHIFHYAGHGNFELQPGVKTGQGSLALTDVDGKEKQLLAEDLALTLSQKGVRLAVLGACKTGRVDQINAWTGIAPALTRAGIPAVIGMQFSIEDHNAVLFSQSLYQGLAAGKSIDEAVSEGRRSVKVHAGSQYVELDWGAPVLYLRSEGDGILFPRATDVASRTLKKVEDELTGKLAGLRTEFQASLKQFDVIKDYKDLHDNLHDLQFAWFPLVRQKVAGLPDAKGALYELRSHERDLRAVIGKLKDTITKNKVDKSEKVWVDDLEIARQDYKKGIDSPEPQMSLINGAMERIKQVLDTQPNFINGSLMRAVGAVRLPQLIGIVQRVFDESIAKDPNKQIVENFKQGIEELKQINEDLSSLTKEHDIWQRSEATINMIQLMVKNLDAFEVLWKQLKADTSPFYQNSTEEWAADLRAGAADLDQASSNKDADGVIRCFSLFSKDAKLRFWNVDKSIKQRCEALVEIRARMESV